MACEVGTASISASEVRDGISTRSDSSAARFTHDLGLTRRVDQDKLGALALELAQRRF